jgi:hypothetical protein
VLPQMVAAQNYTFTNIADNTGPFSTFIYTGPRLNNSGDVAFTAFLDGGGSGVYRSDGVVTTTIADESGPNDSFNISDINDAGQVAYFADSIPLGPGIFRGDGLTVTTIILQRELPFDSEKFLDIHPVTINNAGTVAFYAHGKPSSSLAFDGVFVGNGGNITMISDPESDGRAYYPEINNLGTVAFNYFSVERGIRLGNGGTTSLVINDTGPYSDFGAAPSLNDNNIVAVGAEHDDGGWYVLRIDGATVDVVAGPFFDDGSPFDVGVLDVGLNNAGDVAFLAQVAPDMYGILTGPDPVADKVIGDGDALFGSTATILQNVTTIDGPNDAGQIVFRYSLADGRSGIALATPMAGLAGDYNHDDVVNAADYVVWRKALGQPDPPLDADGNCNGQIDPGDYDVWQENFGETLGSGATANSLPATEAVPEPYSLVLLCLASALLSGKAIKRIHRNETVSRLFR